jgi:hypothetical protein
MAIKINELTKLLDIFPEGVIVRDSTNGLTLTNADGSGKVILLNDNVDASAKTKLPGAA